MIGCLTRACRGCYTTESVWELGVDCTVEAYIPTAGAQVNRDAGRVLALH
jgi:hypothetical protein